MHPIGDVLVIVKESWGLEFLFRWAHVVVGIAWIGLLYYFNFVQVPAFAELDAGARNQATDKVASRALWWFRWAAVATVVFGVLILLVQPSGTDSWGRLFYGEYYKTFGGIAISLGILLGLTMFANVWLVIWPNQKKVIANARNVLAGGEADPAAADAGRRALMASRQNAIFSFTMLLFMVGTSHFFASVNPGQEPGSERGIFWAVSLVVWALLELNCLGIIGGRGTGGTNWFYDNHKRALGTGLVLVVFWYLLWTIVF